MDEACPGISNLSHPYICSLHDVGNQDGIDYLVMEFIEGETLADPFERCAAKETCGCVGWSVEQATKMKGRASRQLSTSSSQLSSYV
jgi:serine/threonine protein kinase